MKNNTDEGFIVCACGSAWFELRRATHDSPAGVAVSPSGEIIAYAGELHCIECGAAKPEPDARPDLRVVDPI